MQHFLNIRSAQPKTISNHLQPKCKKHNEDVVYLCSRRECITHMKYALCEYCFNDHEHDHIIITISQVFSSRLKEQIEEVLTKQEINITKKLKKSDNLLGEKIDEIFESLETQVSKILKNTRVRLMSILSNNWKAAEFTSLKEEFESILQKYQSKIIDTDRYIYLYLEKY